jgi:hypothetical protein
MTGAEMRGSGKEEKRDAYSWCQIAPRNIAIREIKRDVYPVPNNRPRIHSPNHMVTTDTNLFKMMSYLFLSKESLSY